MLRHKFSPLLMLGLLLSVPAVLAGGLVDFSNGLMDYAARRFGWDAPARLTVMQRTVRQIKTSLGPNFTVELLKANDASFDMKVLVKTNAFYNQIPYYTDQDHWGVEDYWATPVETVASFGGDCEDYAIAKYMTLKELGVPISRLRITYVRALNLGVGHMVLAYYSTPEAEPLILDNLIPAIKPASSRTDLMPVYSFNDEDLFLSNGTTKKGGASSVRLWQDLIEKMEREKKM